MTGAWGAREWEWIRLAPIKSQRGVCLFAAAINNLYTNISACECTYGVVNILRERCLSGSKDLLAWTPCRDTLLPYFQVWRTCECVNVSKELGVLYCLSFFHHHHQRRRRRGAGSWKGWREESLEGRARANKLEKFPLFSSLFICLGKFMINFTFPSPFPGPSPAPRRASPTSIASRSANDEQREGVEKGENEITKEENVLSRLGSQWEIEGCL